jgi:hypothetical protein
VAKLDEATAIDILGGGAGIRCRGRLELGPAAPLPLDQILGRLTEPNLDIHVNHYSRVDPRTGKHFFEITPFISPAASSTATSRRRPMPRTARSAPRWSSPVRITPIRDARPALGWIIVCYVLVGVQPAPTIPGVAEEVRKFKHLRPYSPWYLQGEVTAKVNVPSRQILYAERCSRPTSCGTRRSRIRWHCWTSGKCFDTPGIGVGRAGPGSRRNRGSGPLPRHLRESRAARFTPAQLIGLLRDGPIAEGPQAVVKLVSDGGPTMEIPRQLNDLATAGSLARVRHGTSPAEHRDRQTGPAASRGQLSEARPALRGLPRVAATGDRRPVAPAASPTSFRGCGCRAGPSPRGRSRPGRSVILYGPTVAHLIHERANHAERTNYGAESGLPAGDGLRGPEGPVAAPATANPATERKRRAVATAVSRRSVSTSDSGGAAPGRPPCGRPRRGAVRRRPGYTAVRLGMTRPSPNSSSCRCHWGVRDLSGNIAGHHPGQLPWGQPARIRPEVSMNTQSSAIPITTAAAPLTPRRGCAASDGSHHLGHFDADQAGSPSPPPVDLLTVARAEALFASDLPTESRPTRTVATRANRACVHRHGGIRGCAAAVAFAYGDSPEIAASRMRWARDVAQAVFDHKPRSDPTEKPRDEPTAIVEVRYATERTRHDHRRFARTEGAPRVEPSPEPSSHPAPRRPADHAGRLRCPDRRGRRRSSAFRQTRELLRGRNL